MRNEILEDWNIVEKNGQTMIWKDNDSVHSDVDVSSVMGVLNETPKLCTKTNSLVFVTDQPVDFRKESNYSELELISRYIEPTQDYYIND